MRIKSIWKDEQADSGLAEGCSRKDIEPGRVEKEANYSGLEEEDERDPSCGARV
jgi:hypothetical protein